MAQQVQTLSTVEVDDTGGALGMPALFMEGSRMQAGTCEVSCDGVERLAGETPGQPPLSAAAGAHVRGGCSAALGMAAVVATTQATAAAKAAGEGGGEMTNDDGGTEPTVPLKSWSNVEGRAGSVNDVQMDAAEGAGSCSNT